jgi:hypothetical protein
MHPGRPISGRPHNINRNARNSWRCVMLISKPKPLVVPVPRESNFRIPEGRYRAKITSVRKLNVERLDGAGEVLRLLFEVQVPSLPNRQNLAKAEYRLEMNPGSDLRNVLTRLLGKRVFADAGGGTIDLEQLANMDCEVEIEHVVTSRREEYSYPLVRVRDIRKPGTMQLTDVTVKDPNYACH